MRVVCISDTHGDHAGIVLPDGDVLVHAGDLTAHGAQADYLNFLDWFAAQPFRYKLFIAGNHDTWLESEPEQTLRLAQERELVYLNDTGVTINGVRFWGSPITPRFYDWSFMRDPGDDINQHWTLIPENTDVLVTHGPAWGVLDLVERAGNVFEHTGCESLLARIKAINPSVHLFGHIHEGYGEVHHGDTRFVNVSTMDMNYRICNAPVVLELAA